MAKYNDSIAIKGKDEIDNLYKFWNRMMLIAGLSSLFYPGLGQIYNKQIKKGFKYLIAPFFAYLLYNSFFLLFSVMGVL